MNTLTTYTPSVKHMLLQIAILLLVVTSTSAQYVIKLAGNDSCGFYGDGGPATSASFRAAASICSDNAGNLYVGSSTGSSGCVRKISAAGIVTTIAGSSGAGSTADNIPATDAFFTGNITGVCIDPAGNLLIADAVSRIRKVTLSTGIITTVAGTLTSGYSGDGGPATAALLRHPSNVASDASGNIYLIDLYNHVIRKISAATGIISTVVGGPGSVPPDGAPATSGSLAPGGMGVGFCVDTGGNIFIPSGLYHIRKVSATTGIITTVAGAGYGFSGDGGPATAAYLNDPYSLAIDNHSNLYFFSGNGRIRKITAATGIITTLMGDGTIGLGDTVGDNGPATAAKLLTYTAVACDTCGNVYIASLACHVRMITPSLPVISRTCAPPPTGASNIAAAQPSLSIYPNPTSGAFTISISGTTATQAHIVVINALGQKVYEATATTGAPIPIPPLTSPPGTYFVHVATAASRWTEQVVVK